MYIKRNVCVTPVPKRIMEMFGVLNAPLVAHMIRRAKF